MNTTIKRCIEFVAVAVITCVIALSSPLNPWMNNQFTAVQENILDIAMSVRQGFLAYVELDGHYGPVVYEFFGLGFLPTETHLVQFIMETIVVFVSVTFLYRTAKLFTSPVFAIIATAIITILEWGQLTHAGAEELVFFVMSLSCYHIARQLKSGFLSHHSYLLAIDLGLIFFLQPGYIFFWIVAILCFAIKFKVDGIDNKAYVTFWRSTFEGLLTVAVPMGLYLWYFKNAGAFLKQVVSYNFQNIGGFAGGIKLIFGNIWIIALALLVVAIIVKAIQSESVTPLIIWLFIIIVAIIVVALQGDNLPSFVEVVKPLYIVPLASIFSLCDKVLGLKIEERY